MIKLKSIAKQLAQALESAANLICPSNSSRKPARSLSWEIDCSIATRVKSMRRQNVSSFHKTFPVQIERRRSGPSPWAFPEPLELEAILGLWVWSLVSDFSMQTQDKYNNVRVSRASEVPIRRIISIDADYPYLKLWNDIWIDGHEDVFDCKDAQSARPSNVFTLKPSGSTDIFEHKCEALVSDLPQDLRSDHGPRVVRYFGWHNIETYRTPDEDFGYQDSGSDSLTLNTTRAESLVFCCAQDIFGSFIKSLLSDFSNFGRIHVEEGSHSGRYFLSSTVLTDMMDIFVSNGLGSKETAFLCVMPAMFSQLRNLPVETAFQIAMATLKKHCESKRRRFTYWSSAGEMLVWAWNICKQPPRQGEVRLKDYPRLCAMIRGELYRIGHTNIYSMELGRYGIRSLLYEGRDQSETCRETIQCYGSVLEELEKMKNERQHRWVGNNSNLISSLISLTQPPTGLAQTRKQLVLCEAAGLGWAEVVLASLTSGADPDLADEALGSETPLCHAVKNKNANVVDILIEWGASQYLRSSEGLLPLDLAVLNGHHVIIKSLLDTFDPTRVSDCRGTDIRGKTTLHIAAGQEDESIVEFLIKSGRFDLNRKDDDGNTPLQIAANKLAETPVELLVDTHELRMETENDYSLSPLDMAIFKGQEATLKMFFDVYKVDPKSRDYYGNTLLHKAVDCRQEAIVKLLIDSYHIDPESQNNERSTPLHYAANLPGTEMAQLLLETYHVDPNHTDFAIMTPLHVAIKYGRNDVAKLLLGAGHVDRERRASQGLTPLHWATRSPDGQIARLLIETYNVDPDVKDNDGRTPLENAILAENLDIVDFMVNVSGEEARAKALLLAKEKGYDKVTDLLARKEEQLGSSVNK